MQSTALDVFNLPALMAHGLSAFAGIVAVSAAFRLWH